MRSFLLASTVLAASVAAPAFAEDAPAAPFTISGSATVVTDYRFRGISQTSKHYAAQAGITFAHESGFYVSGWTSTIDDYVAAGSDAEVDLIAGYTKTIDALTVDGGVLYYFYPGAAKTANTDFFEPYASVKYAYGPVTVKGGVTYAPKQKAIGFPHTKDDNLYLYGEVSGSIPDTGISLTGHAGYNKGRSLLTAGLKSYFDWSLTANYTWNKLTFGVSYVDTDIKKGEFTLPNGKQAAKAGVVGSVGIAF
ncbi:TorF family putative porin [Sphingomonas naphthae]|uniref:TorF family putative porin n=1 Tax=Sphingomonas naphthae TaxID=1813468 RepID=A0ABY7TKS4_9SPHN|nr:TorF family putative porin [Sphingomonas naphthae]WCT73566.1 TorF family putative porin [Sphingomonas naphthae]